MKFTKIVLALLLLAAPSVSWADMTDSQVIEFIAQEQAKGTDQQAIVQQLLKRGVSVQQLQRVKEKYGNAKGSAQGSSNGTSLNRSRVNNAPEVVNRNATTMGRRQGMPGGDGKYNPESADFMEMQGLLGGMTPDSTAMFFYEQPRGPKVFGRDIFRNENVVFEPNMNVATPGNYVLGAGDQVFIDIYGATQTSIEATISPDGKIVIDEFGPIALAGMTVDAANKRVKGKLGAAYGDSEITLTVGQTRTIQVNVLGEVAVPGTYTLSAFASVFHALYSAGGVSDLGSLREVKVFRNGREMAAIDLYDYILNGRISNDIRLQDNDAIIVSPYLALVNVAGKAKRPMYYEMKPDESVAQAIKYAGGFAADAYTKTLRLMRKAGGQYRVLNIDQDNMSQILVADGDSLAIDSLVVRYENMVEVKGAVFHPGMYELGSQVRSVKTLVEYAAGITETAMTSRAIIRRMRPDRTLENIRVDLAAVLSDAADDVPLKNEDVLFIPSLEEEKQDQTLSIFGDVYEPGIYQFAHNTTVDDLVLQAGGLLKSASNQVKVSRRATDRNASAANANRSEVFTFTLKDDFSVNGEEGFVLQPFDEVYVLRSPTYSAPANVTVEGEVNFPGTYSLNQNTRISELLDMCGGLTAQAAKNGVYVMRELDADERRTRQMRLDERRYNNSYNIERSASQLQPGAKTLPISDSLLVEQIMRDDYYKLAVNLPAVMKDPGCEQDIVLREGDRIIVDPVINTVLLSGSTPYSGAVPYVKGKRLGYYIRQSGSQVNRRGLKMTYVIGPNGQAQAGRRRTVVEPGSEIYMRETTQVLTTSQKITIWTTVGSTFATAAAVVISVLK